MRLATLAALLALGCGDDGTSVSGRPSSGGLGNTTVAPECGALNQACLARGLDAPLARGGRLDLRVDFNIAGSSGPPVELRATRPEVVAAEGTQVFAAGLGTAAVLMIGPDEQVVDFIHLWVRAADELRMTRYSRDGVEIGQVRDQATLLAGEELLVSFEAFGGAQPLLGQYLVEWSVEGDAVTVLEDTLLGQYRIVAREAGEATVGVTAPDLELSLSLDIEVLP